MPDKKTYTTDLSINVGVDASQFEKFKKRTDKWISAFNLEDTIKKQLIESTSQTWKRRQEFDKILEVRNKLNDLLKDTSINEEARVQATEQSVEANKDLLDILKKQKDVGLIDDREFIERKREIGLSDKDTYNKELVEYFKSQQNKGIKISREDLRYLEKLLGDGRDSRGNEEDYKSFLKEIKELLKKEESNEDKSSVKDKIKWFLGGDEGNFFKDLKENFIDTFGPKSTLAETLTDGLKSVIDSITNFVEDMFKEAFKRMENMASFNLGLSNKYNENAISYLENWGLTGSNAYAMQEALDSVGMSDVEDLFLAQAYGMTEVLEEFKEQFKYFKEEYENSNEEMLLTYQQFQKDRSDFKEHFQHELIDFFTDNKSLITDTLNLLLDTMPLLLNVTKAILTAISWFLPNSIDETTKQASDIYESYGDVNNSQFIDSHDITNYTINGVTPSQLNDLKRSMNKGNINYYNSKAVR